LYQREWKNHPLGKDPEPYLEKELFHDVHEFRKAVDNPHSRLLIARSMLHKKLVGLLLCSRHYVNRKEFCEIDLLLVSKDYRGGGVGRELMEKAFSCYPQADCWDVFPMQRGNDAAIAFYEKMGFEREGTGPGGEKNVYGIDKDQWSYHYRRKGVEKSSKS
jgi:ribosomal protein S18 acetylase RimI-like enzyme